MTNRFTTVGVLSVVLAATAATGITYAATSAHGVKACTNGKGDLSLLAGGKCTSGAHRVTLGAQGPRGLPAAKYFAVVSDPGKIIAGSHGVTAALHGASPAVYYTVNFPTSIEHCAPIASIGKDNNNAITVGEIAAFVYKPKEVIVDVSPVATPDTTATSGFSIAVMC
jgi:hypothetical protein